MREPRGVRIALGAGTILVLLFIYAPLVVIGIYAFNAGTNQAWPLPGLDAPIQALNMGTGGGQTNIGTDTSAGSSNDFTA